VALWEADFSAVKALVDDLAGRVKGDLRSHLAAHGEVVRHALSLVRLRSANRLALRTYGAASAEDALRHFLDHATPEVEDTFATQMAAIARGRTYMEAETVVRTREGDFRHVIYTAAFPAAGDRFDRVLFSVLDVTERHRAEAALRASEERYRNVVESQTDLLCRYRPDATLTFVNDAYCRYFGRRRADLIGIRFTDLVPEESRPAVAAQVAALAREPHGTTTEHEVIRPDGTIGWQQWTAQPVVALDGVVLEIQAVGRDVTERRRAEEALRASQHALRTSHDRIQLLAGKLLTAQEEERRRISRELHDDLNQKLAALAIGLSNLRRRLPPDDGRLRQDVTALHGQAKALAADIRGLSHDLHPAVLEHAGLRAALQAHCAEFTGASGVTVALDVTDGAADLPPDVALCLYRVAQESLRNIARHSGAREARITLRTDREAVHLSVEDTGRGFDPDAPRARAGLGLVSMRERVRLLQGALEIQSRPGRTALLVQLPLRRPAS
jgi:PAS domain S-box-containing protein